MHNDPTAQMAWVLGSPAAPEWRAAGASAATCRGLQYQLAVPSQPSMNTVPAQCMLKAPVWHSIAPVQDSGMA